MKENLAKLVTKENVIKALEKFSMSPNLELRASSGYDVIYKGKRYPPKEVIREAARIQKIKVSDDLHNLNGGAPVNKYLAKMGLIIVEKEIESSITNEIINVKDEFTNWLIAIDGNGKNYFSQQFGSNRIRLQKALDEYESVYLKAFSAELFIVSIPELKEQINIIKKNVYREQTAFSKYSNDDSNHRPRAILGNKNYIAFLKEKLTEIDHNTTEIMTQNSLNQILYGPPGTGKTYNTINKAISIVNPSFDLSVDRNIVKQEYERLLELGHIVFTTFHQSMSYEDFIEGIKPETTPSGNVIYNVKDGVFKELCEDAKNNIIEDDAISDNSFLTSKEFDNQLFYKLSLGNSNDKNDREIYEYCIEHDCIALGYGGIIDYAGKDTKEIYRAWQEFHKDDATTPSYVNYFVNIIKNDDYVIISNGNRKIRAMAKVVGDYFIDLEAPIRYKHFRKVEWVFHDREILSSEVYGLNLSQSTLYQLKKAKLKKDFFTKKEIKYSHVQLENYVLIIDEINRGNVSQIFGELITLIEEDKRLGKDEALEVTLPYSNEKFGVPPNLYIIGTMNTADRSVEALDTALRRRFCFEEIASNPQLIATEGKAKKTQGIIGSIDLPNLLATINNRIEVLSSRDYKIGHAYFMKTVTLQDLKETFKKNIIPLLQEYFYNDYEKIGLVLGKGFFEEPEKINKSIFAPFDTSNYIDNGKIHHLKTIDEAFDISEAIKHLLGEIKPEETE